MKNLFPKRLRKLAIGSLFIAASIILLSAVTYGALAGTVGLSTILFAFGGTASLVSGILILSSLIENSIEEDEDPMTIEDEQHMKELFEKSENMKPMLSNSP